MRVLLVTTTENNPDQGVSREYHLTASALASRGHDVVLRHVDVPRDGHLRKIAFLRRCVHVASPTLHRLARTADIVQVSSGDGLLLFYTLSHRPGTKRPLLVTTLPGLSLFDHKVLIQEHRRKHVKLSRRYRCLRAPVELALERSAIAAADVVHVHNARDASWISRNGWKPESQIFKFDLPVHPQICEAGLARRRSYSSLGLRLLWMGQWIPRKGIAYLPEAFRRVADAWPDATLTIAGAYGMASEAILAEFPSSMRGRVRVAPFLSREQHIELLFDHDLFLFPSLSEGFGFALAEAMATGLPAICTDTGLAAGSLHKGKAYVRVDPGNTESLAGAILRLIPDAALRESLGISAQKVVAETMTMGAFGTNLENAYLEGLSLLGRD